MVSNYNNTLHLIVTLPESVMKTQHRSARASNIFSAPLRPEEDGVGTPKVGRVKRSKSREDILMAEIDDLYAYVRDGGTPPKPKFQYDSDEESYWEEPAYEPLDDFRARLKAIESGQKVSFHEKYRPADPKQLRDLVGGTGAPTVAAQPPQAGPAGLGDATSEGVYGVMSSSSNGAREESGSVEEDPPPLPPRPPEMVAPVTTASPINNVSTIVTTTTSSTSPSATPKKSASTHVRRMSAPLVPTSQLSIHQTPVHRDPPPLDASPSKHSLGSSSTNKDSSAEAVKLTQFTTAIDLNSKDASVSQSKNPRSRTVSRSDSEPSIIVPSSAEFPTTAAQARDSALHRQQSQATGPDGKPDWRERLRRFNALDGGKEKECSSSSSGSAGDQQKGVARRMARDFKDSDISSRTKATSSGSSGGRGVRKRMQTLYL
ncbi:hypothetical protein V1264_022852 [Littorina saxatilis]|uniref:Uncharacterized protein n=2 Tax=Littorina saxatilis TaxID=31220 RepID=A0AAN9GAI2_9CAEN